MKIDLKQVTFMPSTCVELRSRYLIEVRDSQELEMASIIGKGKHREGRPSIARIHVKEFTERLTESKLMKINFNELCSKLQIWLEVDKLDKEI